MNSTTTCSELLVYQKLLKHNLPNLGQLGILYWLNSALQYNMCKFDRQNTTSKGYIEGIFSGALRGQTRSIFTQQVSQPDGSKGLTSDAKGIGQMIVDKSFFFSVLFRFLFQWECVLFSLLKIVIKKYHGLLFRNQECSLKRDSGH